MFSKTKSSTGTTPANSQAAAPQKKPGPPSIISADMQIVGDLVSTGETQIDGTVDGDIKCKDLLVGETAVIKGEISAETIRVHGAVNGEIKAGNVILAATANVVGNILHENISIEKGARLEGHLTRMTDVKKEPENRINLVTAGQGQSQGQSKAAAAADA